VEENVSLTAPANGRLVVKMDDVKPVFFESDFMGMNWHHEGPFFDMNEDSLTMNNVRIEVSKSDDSAWHLNLEKISRGNSGSEAKEKASEIYFQVVQKDSVLVLPRGFVIKPKQQFRNQQVVAVIKVPVGKKIFMSENLSDYHWFNINRNWHNNGINVYWNDADDNGDSWESNTEYIMTQSGLERTDKSINSDNEQPEKPERPEQPERKEAPERKEVPTDSQKKKDNPNGDYRYHKTKTANSASANKAAPAVNSENKEANEVSTLTFLTRMS
jgi:hypothetical protein